MDKAKLHHYWTKFRLLKPWYFLAAALTLGITGVFALRANNLHMAELRDDVYATDRANGDTETALQNLRSYVTTHMNTSLSTGTNGAYPPVQLKYTYERLVQAAGDQVANSGEDLYTSAQHYCEAAIPSGFSGRYRLSCIQQYVESHGKSATQIPDSLYKFDFASPRWSPDLAGWSLVLAVLSLLLAGLLITTERWLKKAAT